MTYSDHSDLLGSRVYKMSLAFCVWIVYTVGSWQSLCRITCFGSTKWHLRKKSVYKMIPKLGWGNVYKMLWKTRLEWPEYPCKMISNSLRYIQYKMLLPHSTEDLYKMHRAKISTKCLFRSYTYNMHSLQNAVVRARQSLQNETVNYCFYNMTNVRARNSQNPMYFSLQNAWHGGTLETSLQNDVERENGCHYVEPKMSCLQNDLLI